MFFGPGTQRLNGGPHYCGPTCVGLTLVSKAEGHGRPPICVAVRVVSGVRAIVPTVAVTVIANPVVWIAIAQAVVAQSGISIGRIPIIASPVTASPIAAAMPIICAACIARVSTRGPRKMLSTAAASTETSVSSLYMTSGMSSSGMPTMTASSAMTPAMTATGIRWRCDCQESCHYQRP